MEHIVSTTGAEAWWAQIGLEELQRATTVVEQFGSLTAAPSAADAIALGRAVALIVLMVDETLAERLATHALARCAADARALRPGHVRSSLPSANSEGLRHCDALAEVLAHCADLLVGANALHGRVATLARRLERHALKYNVAYIGYVMSGRIDLATLEAALRAIDKEYALAAVGSVSAAAAKQRQQ